VDHFDICIVGAGAVGLAIAYQLAHSDDFAKRSIVVVDSLPSFGQSNSSRNSEVIHAGIYYTPGSLKAALCLEGKSLLYAYLQSKDIPYQQIGKLIVAQAHQRDALRAIHTNAIDCGMTTLQWLDKPQLEHYEPEVSACFALYSATTGIFDSHAYMASLLHDSQQQGVIFAPNTTVLRINPQVSGFSVETSLRGLNGAADESYEFSASAVINAAGLGAQRLAESVEGLDRSAIPKLHYCKGDYFTYSKPSPFSHLIYPVPEANTTGLGIHSTLDMNKQLRFGPDTQYLDAPHYDVDEGKREKFAGAIQAYFPAISASQLMPGYAGIRPKLSGPGEAAADFMIQTADKHGIAGLIQLFGIESPGLTASLAIGRYVRDQLELP
jgi:L-2-hydroxyglutarate oxidase LhgO